VNDILTCCVIASKTGNSLSTVIEKRKPGGDMESVYTNLSIAKLKRTEISALVSSFSEEVNIAGKSGEKAAEKKINENTKTDAGNLSSIAGVSKDSILDAMTKGDSTVDIIKAIAMTKKVSGSFISILELKREGGWAKVNSYYGTGSVQSQTDINRIIKEINDKLKPLKP
jgi:hypothetical protein